MTEYSKEVREEAARRANEHRYLKEPYTAANICVSPLAHALCQVVLDGALHLDPVELDQARWEEATLRFGNALDDDIRNYRRLVREGWTPPEPVDPVEQVEALMSFDGGDLRLGPALSKLRLKIVPEDGQ